MTQEILTCSKSSLETLEETVKYVSIFDFEQVNVSRRGDSFCKSVYENQSPMPLQCTIKEKLFTIVSFFSFHFCDLTGTRRPSLTVFLSLSSKLDFLKKLNAEKLFPNNLIDWLSKCKDQPDIWKGCFFVNFHENVLGGQPTNTILLESFGF